MTHFVFECRGKKEDRELIEEFERVCAGANYRGEHLPFQMTLADKKSNCCGLQLADVMARPIGRNTMRPNEPNRAFDIIRKKFYRDGGSSYEAPIARALAAALSRKPQVRREERVRAEQGLDLLRSSPRGLAGLTDEEAEELRGGPVIEVLLQLSFEERYRNPEEMLRLALLAKTAAENLDPREADPELVADHQARAWAELGNAHRVNDELTEAEAALDIAEERAVGRLGANDCRPPDAAETAR